ncbi:MAG: FecR domain-containing protein, partial [Candidatus Zipacnadales bacterium]
GSRLRLRSATEISVEELMLLANETSRIRVRMAVGELFANVRRLPTRESRFVVDSPLLTVGVRGTAFHMVVEATQARVNVTEGEVEVTRRFTAPDPVTGATTTEEVVRTLKTGEWLSALSGRRQVLSDQLTREDVAALSHESVKISPDEWRILRQPATWLPFVAIVISVLLVYLLVVFVQPVLAPIDVEEVSAAARRLDQQGRERRASDSPAAAALAQMYLNLGDLETARRELQSIVDVDPNSEFGQWALRTLAALERRQPGR